MRLFSSFHRADEIDDRYLADASPSKGFASHQQYAASEDGPTFQRLSNPTKSFREKIMEEINAKLLRSPQTTRCPSPVSNTLKMRFRLRKKSSSSENSCPNETSSVTSTVNSLNSSLNLDLKRTDSKGSRGPLKSESKSENDKKRKDSHPGDKGALKGDLKSSCDLSNIDADPVFNGLVNEDDLLIEHDGVVVNAANNDRDIENAWAFVKQLTNALRYLQDVVEKDILEQLSGAASILLEIVVSGYAKLRAHLIINEKR